ncbi:MAG: Lrp/AsnC family transcriptional regulator [Alphaproteobacteria bacterium]|nr:Lrp/AsnC family transcriptional regulator [Alphaproteobacteria bacterium]
MDAAARARLLNDYQRDFPLTSQPFLQIAAALGTQESQVLEELRGLMVEGVLCRVGAVVRPNSIGASTLAAMAVPPERLETVAAQVSAHAEVNHNYEREHRLNLWFVVTAADRARIDAVLRAIEAETGIAPLDLPLQREYRIDLGFDLS